MSHLTTARILLSAAMVDPDGAAALLSRAMLCLDAALASVTPATPESTARAIVEKVEELFAIAGCFEEAEESC